METRTLGDDMQLLTTPLPWSRLLLRFTIASMILAWILAASGSARISSASFEQQPQYPGDGASAVACTLYASPNGSPTNPGTSPLYPLTLKGAADRTQPGDVVCLLPGTYAVDTPFQITRSGTPSNWIVYRSYDGGVVITPQSGTYSLMQVTLNVRYIEINGLEFDGKNSASGGASCKGGDHIRFIGNTVKYTGAAGIATAPDPATGKGCDYIVIDHNKIYHTGYNQGWSSGISVNGHSWYDQYQGFHSIVTNNIVSGNVDNSSYHSDGNGIIVDHGGDTPPVLIANNVVYQNGGRCIHSTTVTNIWYVNNTCYKNGLDLRKDESAEFMLWISSGNYVVNNISYAWGNRRPYSDEQGTTAKYLRNTYFTSGDGLNYLPSSVLNDPNQVSQADPAFVNPPTVDATADGQYANALPPDQVVDQFHLQPISPAIDTGIDPVTIPGIDSAIINDLRKYIYTDIEGNRRPQGSNFDLGAYESAPSGSLFPFKIFLPFLTRSR